MHKILSIVFFLTLSLSVLTLQPQAVVAQSNTRESVEDEETSGASESSDIVGEELTKRIQKVLEEKREQVKGALDTILSEKRAMIGEVQRVTDDAITIQHQGGTTIIPLSGEVQLIKGTATISVEEVAVGNWATVLGNKDRNAVEPEFVVISTKTLLPKKQVVLLGTITKLTRTSMTVQPRGDESEKTIAISGTTIVQTPEGAAAKAADLSTDLTVLVSGVVNTTDDDTENDTTIQARTIRSLAPLE